MKLRDLRFAVLCVSVGFVISTAAAIIWTSTVHRSMGAWAVLMFTAPMLAIVIAGAVCASMAQRPDSPVRPRMFGSAMVFGGVILVLSTCIIFGSNSGISVLQKVITIVVYSTLAAAETLAIDFAGYYAAPRLEKAFLRAFPKRSY